MAAEQPNDEAVAHFMAITGANEQVANHTLEVRHIRQECAKIGIFHLIFHFVYVICSQRIGMLNKR